MKASNNCSKEIISADRAKRIAADNQAGMKKALMNYLRINVTLQQFDEFSVAPR